ncbi:MAG: hypothetical protein OXD43_00275 [Bacteroidetes bacterium]|nr:hypothetical protein [Bacteroidota bacterium]
MARPNIWENVSASGICTCISEGIVKATMLAGRSEARPHAMRSRSARRQCAIVCVEGRTVLRHGNPSTSRMIHLESRVRETRTPGSEGRRPETTYGSLTEGQRESDGIATGP